MNSNNKIETKCIGAFVEYIQVGCKDVQEWHNGEMQTGDNHQCCSCQNAEEVFQKRLTKKAMLRWKNCKNPPSKKLQKQIINNGIFEEILKITKN